MSPADQAAPSGQTRGMFLEIEIFDGAKKIAQATMDQTKIIIGRILSADFRISDQRISRIHALIERQDDGTIKLTDLASTHGTFVNGERVIEKIIAVGRDQVELANLKVTMKFVSPAAVAVARSQSPTSGEALDLPSASRIHEPNVASSGRPAPAAPAAAASRGVEIAIGQSTSQKVRVTEPTVIRSLKETAHTRGVLESAGLTEELEVTAYWEETILAIDHYRKSAHKTITVGDGPGNTFVVPTGAAPNRFDFIKVRGQQAEIFLAPGMKGSARVQGRMQSLDELMKSGRNSVIISGQDIAKIRVGTVNFFLMFVPEPPPMARDRILNQGGLFWGIYFSLVALLALATTLGTLYQQPIEGQVREIPERLRKILVEEYQRQQKVVNEVVNEKPVEKPVEVKKDPPKKTGDVAKKAEHVPDAQMIAKDAHRGGNEGEGMKEKGAEGKRGWKNSKFETGITNRPKVKNATKTFDGQKKATKPDAGPGTGGGPSLLDSLRNTGLGAKLAKAGGSGSGQGGGAQGNDPLDAALLGVGGGGIRSGRGSGGSGLQGSGTGGGGTAVGVGGLGSKGFGGGAHGDGTGSIPGKGEFAIGTETAEIIIVGGISRDEIERVVNAHRNEIQFCYQRELQRNPGLSGKVLLQWSIGEGGKVGVVRKKENTTGSVALENCVRDKLSRWIFPNPPGGTDVTVDWPWTFKPQGL